MSRAATGSRGLASLLLIQGTPVRDVLRACRVTQDQVAARAGTTQAHVSRALAADAAAPGAQGSTVSLENRLAIYRAAAELLGVPASKLPGFAALERLAREATT